MWEFDTIHGYWMSEDLKQRMIENSDIFHDPNGELSDQIRVLVQTYGEMSLNELVKRTGLSKSHVSQIMSKHLKSPYSQFMRRLEDKEVYYSVTKESIDYLLDLIGDIIDWAENDIRNENKCLLLTERLKKTAQVPKQKLYITIAMTILCNEPISQRGLLSHFYLTQSYLSSVMATLVKKSGGLITMEQRGNTNLYRVSHKRFLEAMCLWRDITKQRLDKRLYGTETVQD